MTITKWNADFANRLDVILTKRCNHILVIGCIRRARFYFHTLNEGEPLVLYVVTSCDLPTADTIWTDKALNLQVNMQMSKFEIEWTLQRGFKTILGMIRYELLFDFAKRMLQDIDYKKSVKIRSDLQIYVNKWTLRVEYPNGKKIYDFEDLGWEFQGEQEVKAFESIVFDDIVFKPKVYKGKDWFKERVRKTKEEIELYKSKKQPDGSYTLDDWLWLEKMSSKIRAQYLATTKNKPGRKG